MKQISRTKLPPAIAMTLLTVSMVNAATIDVATNTLTVFETGNASNAVSFSAAAYPHNTHYTELFSNKFFSVNSLTFVSGSGGNVRIDNIEASALAIPPTGWLLASGVMGLVGLSRKRVAV